MIYFQMKLHRSIRFIRIHISQQYFLSQQIMTCWSYLVSKTNAKSKLKMPKSNKNLYLYNKWIWFYTITELCLLSMIKEQSFTHINQSRLKNSLSSYQPHIHPIPPSSLCLRRLAAESTPPPITPPPPHTHPK
jgi:hypothetical protein